MDANFCRSLNLKTNFLEWTRPNPPHPLPPSLHPLSNVVGGKWSFNVVQIQALPQRALHFSLKYGG